jgi:hypothetical protein
MKAKKYLTYGPGFSGEHDDLLTAQQQAAEQGGNVYVLREPTEHTVLKEFLADWAERVRKGEVRDLDPVETATLRIYANWKDAHK